MYNEKESYSITGLPVLKDNIIWIWAKGTEAVAIDPAVAKPVVAWLKKHKLKLIGILQTHHHDDHIGGTQDLLKQWPEAEVIASKADLNRIPFQTISVTDQDEFYLMGCKVVVIGVNGHTSSHIAFYIPPIKNVSAYPSLFSGDTLFAAGCGRLFEGTPEEMFNSLQKINQLPKTTKIYCAHEYTEANLRWAMSIYPEDLSIEKRYKKTKQIIHSGLISLPTSLEEERQTNLFIRARSIEEFTRLRLHKDNWK